MTRKRTTLIKSVVRFQDPYPVTARFSSKKAGSDEIRI